MIRRAAVGALLGALLVAVGSVIPASAASNVVTASITATATTITVDLSGSQYALPPNWIRVTASRNVCTAASPCQSSPEATVYLSTGFNGTAILSGLRPNTLYKVDVVLDDGGGEWAGSVTTPKGVPPAPTDPPLAAVSADGLRVVVTAQAETDPDAVTDGGSLAALRYNVDAVVNGKLLRRVLSNVRGGTTRTIAGLPRNTPITFVESDVNSVGGSPGTPTVGRVVLASAAPGAFVGTWQTVLTRGVIRWSAPLPGAGKIAKYVVTVTSGSRTVFAKTVSASTRQVAVPRLARKSTFTATITAVNSYGATTTISGPLLTT